MESTFLNLGQDIVQVLVGKEETAFSVHKDLLSSQSPYFRGAFERDFLEKDEATIRLPDAQPAVFKIFQQWLYGQLMRSAKPEPPHAELFLSTANEHKAPGTGFGYTPMVAHKSVYLCNWRSTEQARSMEASFAQIVDRLLDVYIFADAYETRRLRNDVITALHYVSHISNKFWHGLSSVPKAYAHLPVQSTFCKYLVKRAAKHWLPAYSRIPVEYLTNLPPTFLVQLATINSQRANGKYAHLGRTEEDISVPGKIDEHMRQENLAQEVAYTEVKAEDYNLDQEVDVSGLCHFHEHTDLDETTDCQQKLVDDQACVSNLLSTCMASVRQEPFKCIHAFYDIECNCKNDRESSACKS